LGPACGEAVCVCTLPTHEPDFRPSQQRHDLCLTTLIAAGLLSTASAMAQPTTAPGETVRLQTPFTGIRKCLDIVNDGRSNQLTMADCGRYSGQAWSIQQDGAHYRLRTLFTGDRQCLDIVNDGENNKLTMARCENVSGQLWSLEQDGNFYRLRTMFTGPKRCLDIVNDGANNRLSMATCADVSGQIWGIYPG